MLLPKIPNYEIKQQIAQGGMATVYKAIHLLLEREVALKIMATHIGSNQTFRERFIAEARIAAKLKHPHIIHIYDTGIHEDQLYITMELLAGGSLKDLLQKNGKLSIAHSISIMEQLTSALQYAHSKGFIHRDIKPANILFNSNSDAVLADFGIAKPENSISEMTQMGLILGSPHYMPPEQTMGGKSDTRSDIYSLGIVFFEMLTGEKPYNGANTNAVTYAHAHKPTPFLPENLQQFQPILNKALAKQPEHRFDDSHQFLSSIQHANLRKIASKENGTTVLQPRSERVKTENTQHEAPLPSKGKNRLAPVLYALVFLSVIAIAGYWIATYYLGEAPSQEAPTQEAPTQELANKCMTLGLPADCQTKKPMTQTPNAPDKCVILGLSPDCQKNKEKFVPEKKNKCALLGLPDDCEKR